MDAGKTASGFGHPALSPSHPTAWSRARQRRVRAAVRDWLLAENALRAGGTDVVAEMLRGHGTFVAYEHYPPNDVLDATTGCQYYYHAHRDGEHGHFHCFVRLPLLPDGGSGQTHVTPAASSPTSKKENIGAEVDPSAPFPTPPSVRLAHLIAISMNAFGEPQGLFLTNRWVTDETWCPAARLIPLIERFAVSHAYPNWAANVWLSAFVRATAAWIAELLRARDAVMQRLLADHPQVFEDRSVELLASMDVRTAWPQLVAWAQAGQ